MSYKEQSTCVLIQEKKLISNIFTLMSDYEQIIYIIHI